MLSEQQSRVINKVVSDILKGYTLIKFNGQDMYIKHFSAVETVNIDEIKEEKHREALSNGLI